MLRRPRHYDAVLRVRRLQEDLCAQALASARRDVERARETRDQLLEQRRVMLMQAGERTRGRFDAREVRLYYQYERRLARFVDEQDAEIVRLGEVVREKRTELEEAMKKRRMIEKLRERRVAAYEAAVRAEEQKRTDESATTGHATTLRMRREEGRP